MWWSCWWLSSYIKICSWLVYYKWKDQKTFYCFVRKWRLNEDSGNLSNINLDDTTYDEDDPETIIHVKILAWHIKFVKFKALEKELNEELISVAWHTKRWCNFCMSDDGKKEREQGFTV